MAVLPDRPECQSPLDQFLAMSFICLNLKLLHLQWTNICIPLGLLWFNGFIKRASLVAQMIKNPPAMQETWVWSLGWHDPPEEGMATHSTVLAWRIPCTEEPGSCSPWGHKELDRTEWLSTAICVSYMQILCRFIYGPWASVDFVVPRVLEPVPVCAPHAVSIHLWGDTWLLPFLGCCECCCSDAGSCLALCDPHGLQGHQASLSFTVSREFAQTHVHWVSDAI